MDLAAIGIALAACMLAVQATWTPPLITPAEVGAHVGERVMLQGMVVDLRIYDDTSRFTLVSEGAAVHARAEKQAITEHTWVSVTATVDRDGGRPLLRVEAVHQTQLPDADYIDLVALARDPGAYENRLVSIQGHLDRGTLEGKGLALQTTARGSGSTTLSGILRFETQCVCYLFHAEPWTP